ncbi:hypothetical protein MPPM_5433 (plasmid) [Methylorubrum populi]|jgi:wobble nucleotide-excising tRNase|uniref:Protein CR006 P-loop domain-containing protein n=1 Tax=Methylorubrum populi TaxID=223967 RepID=A0A161JLN3_9HYPH|nr:AAA family ATPase [Methylorubrum populi]OAH27943.1 hypothetical protein AX289_28975 [Methylorubrum populi]BAU94038.1 hypothetical protein MPPM_5433 [Methylorubrum populi]
MIRKIISLKGIGRFEGFNAAQDVTFKKYTLIFAENGVGKTTLCDVIRSLQTGDPGYIIGRRTLNSAVEQEAKILLADGTVAIFSNGQWSKQPQGGCTIFDSGYVRDNVHAGEVVDLEHKKALFSLIVGQQGVSLHHEVVRLEKERSDLNTPLRTAKQAVEANLPSGVRLAAYLALEPDPDIDAKISDAERLLRGSQEEEALKRHRILTPLSLPVLPSDLEEILARTLENVADSAQRQLDSHLAHLGAAGGQAWLSQGLSLLRGENCPFCAQSISGNDLVAAYRACFSEAYRELFKTVTAKRAEVEAHLGTSAVSRLETTLAQNAEAISFWSRYCELAPLAEVDAEALGLAIDRLRIAALALLEQKERNLLDAVEIDDDLSTALTGMEAAFQDVPAYNAAVEAANRVIEARRGALAGIDVAIAKSSLENLQRRKRRFEDPVKTSCDEYNRLQALRDDLDTRKETAVIALKNYSAGVVRDYQQTLNKHLARFMVGFRIEGTRTEFPRGYPSSSYQLMINDVPVELGNENTTHAEPSFRNTLSGGDRSALALSLFMAQLERSTAQPDIAVILDDPFQSQDAFRKNATAHQIRRCGEQCGQVVVLSHDPTFIKMVWDKLPPDERKALRLVRVGQCTNMVPHDVEEHLKPEHQSRIDAIQRYVHEGQGEARNVAQKLRLALEGYCKIVSPGEFPDGLMMGEICRRVRETGSSHLLHPILDDLEELNDYARQYHHASNDDHASVPIDEGELLGYSRRILALIRSRAP